MRGTFGRLVGLHSTCLSRLKYTLFVSAAVVQKKSLVLRAKYYREHLVKIEGKIVPSILQQNNLQVTML